MSHSTSTTFARAPIHRYLARGLALHGDNGTRTCRTRRIMSSERRMLAGVLVLLLSSVAILGAQGRVDPTEPAPITLEFLRVGQGDATLITTAEGRRVLIDAGPNANEVANLLGRRGVDTLDLAVASHNHADHIGGMAAVLRQIVVRAYLDNGVPATTVTYERTLRALEERGVRYLRASERRISVGTLLLRVLPMPPRHSTREQNDQTVGLVVEYGVFRALLAGDAEQAQRSFWRNSARLRAHVLKVAHHGSANGTDEHWLAAVQPSLAVIPVGERNSYGHPAHRTLKLLAARAVRVLRTDRDGCITVLGLPDGSYRVSARAAECMGLLSTGAGAVPSNVQSRSAPVPQDPRSLHARSRGECCRVCRAGKACGNACIAQSRTCRRTSGCACDG